MKKRNSHRSKRTGKPHKGHARVGLKANGKLKKGYRFAKGGRIVKAKGKR